MQVIPCIVVPAFIALAAAVIVFGILKARQRREAMARLAAELGFEFYPDDPWGIAERYAMFELFGRGHSRKASNILCGELDGRAVVAFDYKYTTGSGKNQSTHHYQGVVLGLPIMAAGLRMRGETVFDRLASWVGWDDIDFESDEFSRRYHVRSEDRRFAYDIFHARLIEHLLACGDPSTGSGSLRAGSRGDVPDLEMKGNLMILYDGQRDAENVRRLLSIGREIVASIPEYVLKARGIGREEGGKT
ncbi:MAG: hypothetical protein WBD63_02880 [Phycisphaerae bacterium]|nr:hypothetical protein [Phycisphaerae bacterium]